MSRLAPLAALLAAALSAPVLHAQLAVRGETVYPVSGAPIRDGVVLVRGGKIERVGPASQVAVPAGWRVLAAKVVTPGLVDAHSVVGLAGMGRTTTRTSWTRPTPCSPSCAPWTPTTPPTRWWPGCAGWA
jgi:imidazolonepropionase-like amidohydrolase